MAQVWQMPRPRKLLVCGPAAVGKTALIQRFTSGAWVPDSCPTVGLDEHAGEAAISPEDGNLEEELQVLLPPEGVKLVVWEIGGTRGGHLRQAPRGQHLSATPAEAGVKRLSLFGTSPIALTGHFHRSDTLASLGTPWISVAASRYAGCVDVRQNPFWEPPFRTEGASMDSDERGHRLCMTRRS